MWSSSSPCCPRLPPPLQLWSRSKADLAITFTPNDSRPFDEVLWVEMTGRTHRIPLRLRGTGVGPRLAFTYDVVDVGEVTITSVHRYELVLANRGEIPGEWAIAPSDTPFGSKFLFDPASGHLPVGGSTAISVYFTSDALGAFNERFNVTLPGCSSTVPFTFKGTVVPPSFTVDASGLDFGALPYDFPVARTFTLTNTSDVPLVYVMRVPIDETLAGPLATEADAIPPFTGTSVRAGPNAAVGTKRFGKPRRPNEFTVSPARMVLAPKASQTITVEATSWSAGRDYGRYALKDVAGAAAATAAAATDRKSVV